MTELTETARRALACLDLTDLTEDCDPGAIRDLCARASTPFGPVAAICIWPRFVAQARQILPSGGPKIATVVNFPGGDDEASEVADLTEQAVEDGADEIDMVIPYRSFMEGREEVVFTRVQRVKRAAGHGKTVKAILETGVLADRDLIRRAADLAIEGGADFIKTSTGKARVNATLSAARTMLEAIKEADRPVGLKPAGGVKTTADAANYLELADEAMGEGWAKPDTFRIGASSALDALIATLKGEDAPTAARGY
ncbi:MAG: deoxyribose-phosphate aldolase [Pseudomonadota bacterium]